MLDVLTVQFHSLSKPVDPKFIDYFSIKNNACKDRNKLDYKTIYISQK